MWFDICCIFWLNFLVYTLTCVMQPYQLISAWSGSSTTAMCLIYACNSYIFIHFCVKIIICQSITLTFWQFFQQIKTLKLQSSQLMTPLLMNRCIFNSFFFAWIIQLYVFDWQFFPTKEHFLFCKPSCMLSCMFYMP